MQVAPDSFRCSVHVSQIKCFITTYMHPCTNGSRSFWLLFGILTKPNTWMSHYHRRIKHQPAFEENIRQLLSGIRRETAYRSTCSVAWLPLSAQNWGGFLSFADDFLDPQLLHMASSICFSPDPQPLLLHQPIQALSFNCLGVHFSSSLPSAPPNPSCERPI